MSNPYESPSEGGPTELLSELALQFGQVANGFLEVEHQRSRQNRQTRYDSLLRSQFLSIAMASMSVAGELARLDEIRITKQKSDPNDPTNGRLTARKQFWPEGFPERPHLERGALLDWAANVGRTFKGRLLSPFDFAKVLYAESFDDDRVVARDNANHVLSKTDRINEILKPDGLIIIRLEVPLEDYSGSTRYVVLYIDEATLDQARLEQLESPHDYELRNLAIELRQEAIAKTTNLQVRSLKAGTPELSKDEEVYFRDEAIRLLSRLVESLPSDIKPQPGQLFPAKDITILKDLLNMGVITPAQFEECRIDRAGVVAAILLRSGLHRNALADERAKESLAIIREEEAKLLEKYKK